MELRTSFFHMKTPEEKDSPLQDNFWKAVPKSYETSDVKKMYIFEKNALMLTADGSIHGIGRNENWLLGDVDQCVRRSNYNAVTSDESKNFKDFATNGEHALAISKTGFLFSWGSDTFDQLGRKGHYNSIEHVTKIFGTRVVKAACGQGFSFVLTTEGKLYEWGKNGFKELTLDWSTEANSSNDKDEENSWAVESIICTPTYPIALSKNGKVFLPNIPRSSSKCNNCLHREKMKVFGEILKDKKVIELSIGKSLVFALTDIGEIFYWKICHNSSSGVRRIEENIGRPIKLWPSLSHEVLVTTNSYGQLFCIYWSDSGECLSVSPLTFQSMGECFSTLGMQLSGPVYDQNSVMYNSVDTTEMSTEWKARFESAFNKKESSDVAFSVENEIIYAHKAIVSIQCPYLEAMLKNWSNGEMNEMAVVIEKYSYPTFVRYLRYLYTGKVEMSSHESNMELLRLAHEYMNKTLLHTCGKMLIQGLNVENVLTTYNGSILFDLEDLRTACKLFMSQNLEDVVLSEDMSNQEKEDLLRNLRDMVCSQNILGNK